MSISKKMTNFIEEGGWIRKMFEVGLEMKQKYGNVEIMTIGSSLKLCMVAEGRADAYPR